MAKKFEYYHNNGKLTLLELNGLGEDGWELVSHTAVATSSSMGQYYVFKREKSV